MVIVHFFGIIILVTKYRLVKQMCKHATVTVCPEVLDSKSSVFCTSVRSLTNKLVVGAETLSNWNGSTK